MTAATRPAWQKAIITLSAVVTAAVLLAFLYVGRVVLIPIAMAIFITYVLGPVVSFLQRQGLGRTPSVALSVLAAVILFLGTSFLIAHQLSGLTGTIADHSPEIKAKVADARARILGSGNSPLNALIDDLDKMIQPGDGKESAHPVFVQQRKPGMEAVVGPAIEAFAQAAFSFILVVFMLLSKTDLADRVLRLVGEGHMTLTTRAMSDASMRVSRYLFRQFVVNMTFGALIAGLLFLLGLKYSLLWGFLIALMRYVPYIGTWLGVIPPAVFAFVTGDTWALPLATVGIIIGLELIINNFLEPLIYGQSLGVSEVAQLISAALWSFLWGPVGLILSSPITTCLLVLGRHAPPFRFLEVLLGNEPALSPAMSLFQRLASQDQDEALRTMRQGLKAQEPEAVFDEMFLPALKQLKISREAGQFDGGDDDQITRIAREVLDDVIDDLREEPRGDEAFVERVRLLACPARDELDRLALDATIARLPVSHWESHVCSVSTLASEVLADAADFKPQVILISSLPPGGAAHARYLSKRLRQRFPEAHILIGRWCDDPANDDNWDSAGSDRILRSIRETLKHLADWKPVFEATEAEAEATA